MECGSLWASAGPPFSQNHRGCSSGWEALAVTQILNRVLQRGLLVYSREIEKFFLLHLSHGKCSKFQKKLTMARMNKRKKNVSTLLCLAYSIFSTTYPKRQFACRFLIHLLWAPLKLLKSNINLSSLSCNGT